MSLVEVLSGNTAEDPPETVPAGVFVDRGLWYNLYLGCVGEEGQGSLRAFFGPAGADVVVSPVVVPDRVSLQGAFAAIQPKKEG